MPRSARSGLLAAALAAAAACASLPEPEPVDPLEHARVTVRGFREASPFVAELLEGAVAWAVFPDVEDATGPCAHAGWLALPDGSMRPARLRCADRPTEPAGSSYHALVILEAPADLATLEAKGLELADAPHLAPHDRPEQHDQHVPSEARAARWVVTSELGGLLHPPRPLRQTLELVESEGDAAEPGESP